MAGQSKSKMDDENRKVCIIGAGPGGLSAARSLKAKGIAYDQFERHSGIGGVWDINNPGSPVYESTHFISSKELSGFVGYPMPADYPDYPSHREILAYLQGFADEFGLRESIDFGVSVSSIEKNPDDSWQVTTSDGRSLRYWAVICATGTNWDPSTPNFPGHFDGELIHSVKYKSPSIFQGKRVLVIGAGNSGVDIASDAASRADSAFLSIRRGYHFIPKHVFGVPVDVFSESGPHLPLWLARPIFGGLLKIMVGKLERLGLPKPDHRLFESHPLLNSQIIHHLQHGNIKVKPDIHHFDGHDAVFTDGSRERIDMVVCATGYKWSCPYAKPYFEWVGGRPQMYLSMFNRRHKNLFGIGYLETNSSAYKLFDTQALMIATYLAAKIEGLPCGKDFEEMIERDEPDLSGGISFVASQRHAVYIDARSFKSYLRKIRKKFGWDEVRDDLYDRLRIGSRRRIGDQMTDLRPAAEGSEHASA